MSGKTKKSGYHIIMPFSTGGGMALEVLETVECTGCGCEVYEGNFVTRKYSREFGVQGYACRQCVPFRFVSDWSTRYWRASYEPVEFERKR